MRKFINLIESAMAGSVDEAVDPMRTIAPGTKKTKKVKLKDGRVASLTIEHEPRDESEEFGYDKVSVVAMVDGQFASHVNFSLNRVGEQPWDQKFKGSWSATTLNTNPDFRRLGLATEMYALATSCGMRIAPAGKYGGKQLPDGSAFWDKQRPEWRIGRRPPRQPDFWKRPKK